MNKLLKTVFSAILCALLLISFCMPAFAQSNIYRVRSAEDLLRLAESCRLDTFSSNLIVEIMTDIDLAGMDFGGIPTFGGIFNGNGYTVSGVAIDGEGSAAGFFRYVRQGAVINGLNVKGSVAPAGSKSYVGGIAGINSGTLENCSFDGTVAGADCVGALVGENKLTGIITGCQIYGAVTGNHFIGGAAGVNSGVIRNTKNHAEINITASQNEVELSDITLESFTESESANTVTDVGGIAGTSKGVIRNCTNYGNVGYRQMGYNVGGIAGSQAGYIKDCVNMGQIYGRKEVGGIVGHMEPVTQVEYSQDTLQILEGQVDTLGGLTDRAMANARSGVSGVTGQMAVLEGQTQDALEAIEILIPEGGELPDEDTVLAAQNALTESLTGMPGTINGITSALEDTVYGITQDLRAVSNQIDVISATIGSASENLGVNIVDVSDDDTDDNFTGKVERCENHGTVSGDMNVGGIAGTIAYENDLDPEQDIDIQGESSLNFSGEIRAVIKNCRNTGSVAVNKQNGGGIVGWQSMGLVKKCLNIGKVSGAEADYVGGISGSGGGYIRDSSAKCEVTGNTNVGGIAGTADVVTDCRSMVRIEASEKYGEVLGYVSELPDASVEEAKIYGNYYLVTDRDTGAVDGISYAMCAQPLKQESFFALSGLAQEFLTVTVRFVFEDGTSQIVTLTPGEGLSDGKIPEIPEKEGYTGYWAGLSDIDVTCVRFDAVIYAEYTQHIDVIESTERTETGLPVILAQGVYDEKHSMFLEPVNQELSVGRREELIAGYSFEIVGGKTEKIRCFIGAGNEESSVKVIISDKNDVSRTVLCVVEGSYAVFEIQDGDKAFAVVKEAESYITEIAIGAAVWVLAVIITVSAVKKKKKIKAAETEE